MSVDPYAQTHTRKRYALWLDLATNCPLVAYDLYEQTVKADRVTYGSFVPNEFGPIPLPEAPAKRRKR